MKRAASFAIMLAMLLGLLPTANAAGKEPIQAADLDVTWYSDWDVLSRLYGTDRMILVKDNLCALYGLDGTKYTDPVFDAIGEYDDQGYAVAMKNGKWGVIDLDGATVLDFRYDWMELARSALEAGVAFVSPRYDGSTSYALATLDGRLLTDYKYWGITPFVNGFALVGDGENWTYLNTKGEEIVPLGRYFMMTNNFGSDGLVIVRRFDEETKTSWENVIDGSGRELFPEVAKEIWRAGEGLWGYRDQETGRVGFLDQATGQVAIPAQYDYLIKMSRPGGMIGNTFQGGVALVYEPVTEALTERKGIYIDTKGNRMEDSAGKAAMEAAVDYRDPDTELLQSFWEGLRWVDSQGEIPLSTFSLESGGPWGFEDETGELVIPCIYDTVGHFDHGYAAVTVDGVYGLLKNPLNKKTEEPEEDKAEVPVPAFADVPAGSWFERGVMTCAQNGIMVGTGEDTFSPNATLTDAESLMLAYRLYDQANGGDGSLLKMPEDYGYVRLVSDDGSLVHEGYIGDGSLWEMPNVYTSSDGHRLCLRGAADRKPGGAALTFGGKEYRGELRRMYRGSGRYEQDNFFGFEPEDPALNDLLLDAYFHTAPPTQWWADLLYTIREKGWGGWDGVFSGSAQLFGTEDSRGLFADLLGAVTNLPKKFDAPPIPDLGARGEENSYRGHIYEMYETGIIGGVDAYGTFDAEKTLTRAEAAVMVARILDESQRLTTPPKAMPKEGEGYTLTYLRNGIVDSGFEQDTYPYYFVAEPITDPDSWERSRRVGFLKLDGSFLPWPESDLPYTLERFGGNTIYWTNIYKAETDEELDRYEVGVLNDDLKWIIKPQYAELWPRKGGYAAVSQEDRYLLLDEKGNVEGEVASRQELPERPYWSGYYEYWADWQNWGGLSPLPDGTYYRWPDGSPATEWFDWCGRIGPDGRGFVQKDRKIYRIEFTQPKT
ncbi:MAG: hypothetical protein HFF06_05600 [Oscillospiraceae bacterium]|jgi:hypothetical protein|nr:hypothetical protein [Oscillospiraceae bacterium]